MYSAVHAVDRLRWLAGSEVTHVTANTHKLPPETEVEDAVVALLRFANGVSGTLMAAAPTYPAQPTIWESEVIGTLGMGRLRNRQWAQMSNREGQTHQDTHTTAKTLGEHYNFVRQAAAFVDAILTDSAPPVSGHDGLAALEIVLAIYAAARTGESVAVA
jgi:predicted dehydrogenase